MSQPTEPSDSNSSEPIDGRYEVIREAGRGAMGRVYEVHDRSSQQRLALKQLSSDASPAITLLFKREFHTLRQLNHPNIVEVFDYGVDPRGPYYTMELLDGADLRGKGAVDWREACVLLCDLASALTMLHARRLVHRDLNYRNARRTADGTLKLLDFGTLASFGLPLERAGTVGFASPEAVSGHHLDARSDLYSLGAVGFWLLTGRRALDARNFDELEPLWHEPVPRPSLHVPELPEALDQLVASLLSVDPRSRPASAGEVIHRLVTIAALPPRAGRAADESYLAMPTLAGRTVELQSMTRTLSSMLRHRHTDPPARAFTRPSAGPSAGPSSHPPTTVRPPAVPSQPAPARRTLDLGPATTSSDRPLALVVRGVAGSGRSRMLAELAVEAQLAGVVTLALHAEELASTADALPSELLSQLRMKRPELFTDLDERQLRLVDSLERQGPRKAILQPVALDDRRARVRELLLLLLQRAARARGVLINVDDADVLDAPAVALLNALSGLARSEQLLLALSVRVATRPDGPTELAWLQHQAEVVELSPLDKSAVQQLATSLFGNAPHVRGLASFLWSASMGHPLSCMQLIAHLLEQQVIRHESGYWTLPAHPAEHGVPESLSATLRARVSTLSDAARELLELLSLFEGKLAVERCVALSSSDDGPPDARVLIALDELVARGLLAGGRSRARLAHDALRQMLVREMDEAKRAVLHRRVGERLAEVDKPTTDDLLDAADHLMRAGEEERGAAILSRATRANPFLAMELGARANPVLQRAETIFLRGGMSRAHVMRLRAARISGQIFIADPPDDADAACQELFVDSGLARFEAGEGHGDPSQRFLQAMAAQEEVYAATPAQQRGLPPPEALIRLAAIALPLVQQRGFRLDLPGQRRAARYVAPLAHSPSAAALCESAQSSLATHAGRDSRAREHSARALALLAEVRAASGPAPLLDVWMSEVHAAAGIRNARVARLAIAHAEALERSSFARVFVLEVLITRYLVHLLRGEQAAAEALEDDLEVARVQQRSGVHLGGMLALHRAEGYA
ncbi:MAG: protein kinase, partial [Polyangiales bacterium]